MKLSVKPGKYVVAVSGGVDSMLLLDALQREPDLDLVVAHFDHGIREDSSLDRQLVQAAAARYGLPFVGEQGRLGPTASEATARAARYAFLERVQEQAGAKAIITAHHQDDLLETAIINMLRGTGRKGLSALASTSERVRPLLDVSKREIYAAAQALAVVDPAFSWREDSTNQSDDYLRNYIRHHLLANATAVQRAELLSYITRAAEANPVIDELLIAGLQSAGQPTALSRSWFIMIPYDVSCEVMAAWLRQNNIRDFDRRTIERLVVAAKVSPVGKRADIAAGRFLKMDKASVQIV